MVEEFTDKTGSFAEAKPVDSQAMRSALESLHLESVEINSVVEKLSSRTFGLVLYGSRARGDFIPSSDFDLLRLTNGAGAPTFKTGRVSVSSYTRHQLESATNTLFGTHLARDARILIDPHGYLSSLIGSIQPVEPGELLARVRRYSEVLNQDEGEVSSHHRGMTRLARYLLRTAIYAQSMLSGPPCFSVRELAERFDDPKLSFLLASDPAVTGGASIELFEELVGRLEDVAGPMPKRRFGSLASLAAAMWDRDRNLAALAIRAADEEDAESLDYSDLPKVLL